MQGELKVCLAHRASSTANHAISTHPDDKKHSAHLSRPGPDQLLLRTAAAERHKPEADPSPPEDGKHKPHAAAVHPGFEGAPGGRAFEKCQLFPHSFSWSSIDIFKSLHILAVNHKTVKVTNVIYSHHDLKDKKPS